MQLTKSTTTYLSLYILCNIILTILEFQYGESIVNKQDWLTIILLKLSYIPIIYLLIKDKLLIVLVALIISTISMNIDFLIGYTILIIFCIVRLKYNHTNTVTKIKQNTLMIILSAVSLFGVTTKIYQGEIQLPWFGLYIITYVMLVISNISIVKLLVNLNVNF